MGLRYGTIGAPPSPPAAVVAVAAATEALVDAKAEEEEAEADDVVKPLSDDVVGVVEPTAVEAPTRPRISNIELPGSQTVEHILRVDDLSLLYTPDGNRQLFANVSYTVGPGEHLLIMGNSGTGKSSMLRAVAGLWTRGYGEVYRPLVRETMFLPQKPYCTLGSLRQQLVYPRTVEEYSRFNTDWNLIKALRTVQLGRLADRGVEGLDSVRDWGDELSLGEQQRLAFARVLVNKPRYAAACVQARSSLLSCIPHSLPPPLPLSGWLSSTRRPPPSTSRTRPSCTTPYRRSLGSLTCRSAIGPHCCDSMRAG